MEKCGNTLFLRKNNSNEREFTSSDSLFCFERVEGTVKCKAVSGTKANGKLLELLVTKSICEADQESLRIYDKVWEEGLAPRIGITIAALKVCGRLKELVAGKVIHANAIEIRYSKNIYIASTLVDMYAKCGSLEDARRVFDGMPRRNDVSWNCLILGYARNGESEIALSLYALMREQGYPQSRVTYLAGLKACAGLAEKYSVRQLTSEIIADCLKKGKLIHYHVLDSGYELETSVGNSLVDMYAKCGSIKEANRVFEMMTQYNVVTWNCMIMGFARTEHSDAALQLFARMQDQGFTPDERTYVAVLKACANLTEKEEGKESNGKLVKVKCLQEAKSIHSQIKQSGQELEGFVETSLLDLYSKCGSTEDARLVFERMSSQRNVVTWNAIILGHAQSGEGDLALQFYARMQEERFPPDAQTFASVLKACASLGALEFGKKVHAKICSLGIQNDLVLATCLLDFYAKCGNMVEAQRIFDSIVTKDLVVWNALIAGYSRQGLPYSVFEIFERMQKEVSKLNDVVFLSLLSVCSHAGLVDKGKEYFEMMSTKYGLAPRIEHYNCMADLLGRINQVNEALELVMNAPFKPSLSLWMTILGACRKWTNVEVGRVAFDFGLKLDNRHAAAYVLMANIYGKAGMWEDSARIQAMRISCKAWKLPGKSWWTDSSGKVHMFVVGDRSHPQYEEISAKLKVLMLGIKAEGYVPHLESVSRNISDDEKESALCGHSEKLAIACALINTQSRTPIRIAKNLRVCEDCHEATAVISKLEQRPIICRDVYRFHVFRDGKCSCMDFW